MALSNLCVIGDGFSGIAPFLDVEQWRFDAQIAMRKHAGEVDEFVEEVNVTAAFRA